jgi:hypothetical protein
LQQEHQELLGQRQESDEHYQAVTARLTQALEQAREQEAETARRNAELTEQLARLTALVEQQNGAAAAPTAPAAEAADRQFEQERRALQWTIDKLQLEVTGMRETLHGMGIYV